MERAAEGLLLLHGTPLTPRLWDGVVTALSTLSSQGAPGPVLTPWVELTEDDPDPPAGDLALAARIARSLPQDAGRWHVVGHSFGGQVAIDLALQHPDRVARLTLISTRDTPFPAFAAAAAKLRSGSPPDIAGALARWFRPDELARSEPIVEYAGRCLAESDHLRWARALESIAAFDRTDRLGEIRAPTHVVAAELDQVSTVDAMAAMADRLRNARFTVWSGAAHLSAFLRPGDVARCLLDA